MLIKLQKQDIFLKIPIRGFLWSLTELGNMEADTEGHAESTFTSTPTNSYISKVNK